MAKPRHDLAAQVAAFGADSLLPPPKITQRERDALCDLQSAMAQAFRSKPTLRVLSSLLAKGLIEWDALGGTGKLTAAGERHLG